MIMIKGYNYCDKYEHEIDYELVKELSPGCIKEHNGCGNCPHCVYRTEVELIP